METERREKSLSILGIILICFSVLAALGFILGPGSMNKLIDGVIDFLPVYLGGIAPYQKPFAAFSQQRG